MLFRSAALGVHDTTHRAELVDAAIGHAIVVDLAGRIERASAIAKATHQHQQREAGQQARRQTSGDDRQSPGWQVGVAELHGGLNCGKPCDLRSRPRLRQRPVNMPDPANCERRAA